MTVTCSCFHQYRLKYTGQDSQAAFTAPSAAFQSIRTPDSPRKIIVHLTIFDHLLGAQNVHNLHSWFFQYGQAFDGAARRRLIVQ